MSDVLTCSSQGGGPSVFTDYEGDAKTRAAENREFFKDFLEKG